MNCHKPMLVSLNCKHRPRFLLALGKEYQTFPPQSRD